MNSGCLLSGLELTSSSYIQRLPLSSDILIQAHRVMLGEIKLTVYTAFGAHDGLEVRFIYYLLFISLSLFSTTITMHVNFVYFIHYLPFLLHPGLR